MVNAWRRQDASTRYLWWVEAGSGPGVEETGWGLAAKARAPFSFLLGRCALEGYEHDQSECGWTGAGALPALR